MEWHTLASPLPGRVMGGTDYETGIFQQEQYFSICGSSVLGSIYLMIWYTEILPEQVILSPY